MKLWLHILLSVLCLIMVGITTVMAQSQSGQNTEAIPDDAQIVNYPVSFFDRYQPSTALEIVRQIPGFILNDGDRQRGFGGSVGNVLINDRRPSAKQDPPSQILSRIPANQVAQIEVIRGQVRNIDLQGHSIVANVILHVDAPATARWESSMRYNFSVFPPTYVTALSLSDRWGDIEYNAGISGRSGASGDAGSDNEFNNAGDLTEITLDSNNSRSYSGSGNLNASTWFGETFVQLNTELFVEFRDNHLSSHVFPQLPGDLPSRETTDGESSLYRYELGTDAERLLSDELLGKGIFLFSYRVFDRTNDEINFDETDTNILQSFADTKTETSEVISRLEFDWIKWTNKSI